MSDNEEYQNQEHISSSTEHTENQIPSAPTSDDNGYIVVQNTQTTEPVAETMANTIRQQEEISNLLADISSNAEANLKEQFNTVFAEADSSVARDEPKPETKKPEGKPTQGSCTLCPYYLLACDYVTKLEVPPQARDLLLWKCPKMTGAVFGSLFVILLSLSLFSLLTVVSTLMLTALAVVGAYKLYLAIVFRIKGTYDETLDKLAKQELPLPKDKIQEFARLFETDLFKSLNTLKSIILWENVTQSVKAFVGFYLVNWIGSCFNLLTLLMLALVTVFTLPKVYQVYKKPIDQTLEKATTCIHQVTKQVMQKIPMLNKKKTQ